MAQISFEQILLGEQYERPELATIWGYRDWHAIGRGSVTPAGDNKIVLFVTKQKQDTLTQYHDHFEDDRLMMEGETNHANDQRLAKASDAGDEIYLFFRERHHSPFTYFGPIQLVQCELLSDRPSRFVFETIKTEALASSAMIVEEITHGQGEDFIGDPEGKKRYALHVTYERSQRNRAEAIRFHGAICICCKFDFNVFYGPEFARDYIEVHHIKSIAETNGPVNPKTDLIPLCSNCHSMGHRKRGEIIPVDDLKEMIRENSELRNGYSGFSV